MNKSNEPKLDIKDLFEELKEENNRLLNELKLTQKLFDLFENYRKFLIEFSNDCKCDQNIQTNPVFTELELQYKIVFKEFNNKIENKSKPKVRPILRTINKNIRKRKHNNRLNIKTSDYRKQQTNKYSDDNTSADIQLVSNKDNNEVKRNQRQDFISPKPIFEINSQFDVESERSPKSVPIIGYICEYRNCNYQNTDKGNVSRHISKMHLNKEPLICEECRQTFWGRKRLFEHKKCIHLGNGLIYNRNRKIFKCDYNECNYETKSLTNLTQHKRRHFGEKPFKCVDCFSCFVTNSELKTHRINIHSNDKPFHCQWLGCDHSFKTKDKLNAHTYCHTGLFPFPCCWPGCDAKYAKQADLKLHQLSHSEEYPFACEWPECSSKFKTKNSRRLHNFTHTGERPFKCEWPGCEASYYMVSKLNRHKLSHNGVKKYVCNWPECDKKYSTSHNLKLHLMAHRNEKPYVCPHCQRRFTDNSQMKRHSKKVHKSLIK